VDQRVLVEQARKGDHDAFAVLVRASAARLDAAARLILRDRELASDAVQEAYIRAWRSLPGLRDLDRFDAWLHRLLVRSCIDALRRRRSRPVEIELDPLAGPSIGDHAADVLERELIDNALRRLDPTWRAVVVLHYFLGMPLADAAATLGIPLGTAKSRLHRSLGLMRLALSEEMASPALSKGHPA
jgi:RNA polymerase sigma factor (sigma-70 family)